jgi:hypothetical protein
VLIVAVVLVLLLLLPSQRGTFHFFIRLAPPYQDAPPLLLGLTGTVRRGSGPDRVVGRAALVEQGAADSRRIHDGRLVHDEGAVRAGGDRRVVQVLTRPAQVRQVLHVQVGLGGLGARIVPIDVGVERLLAALADADLLELRLESVHHGVIHDLTDFGRRVYALSASPHLAVIVLPRERYVLVNRLRRIIQMRIVSHHRVLVSRHHESGAGQLVLLQNLLHVRWHAVDYVAVLVVHLLDVLRDIRVLHYHCLGASQHVVVEDGREILVGTVLRGQIALRAVDGVGLMARIQSLTVMFQIQIPPRNQVGTRPADHTVHEMLRGFGLLGDSGEIRS